MLVMLVDDASLGLDPPTYQSMIDETEDEDSLGIISGGGHPFAAACQSCATELDEATLVRALRAGHDQGRFLVDKNPSSSRVGTSTGENIVCTRSSKLAQAGTVNEQRDGRLHRRYTDCM
eukprot:3995906-Amphidinium_carterae.1